MKENSPICARAAETDKAVPSGYCRASTMPSAASDLPTTMIASTASSLSGSFDQDLRVEEHPDGHEEEPRERVLQRLGIRRRTMAQVRLVDHHAREERPERERHAEELGGAERDPEGERDHGQGEQLARARVLDPLEEPREDSHADHQHQHGEQRDLAQREAER